MIQISEAAAREIRRLQLSRQQPDSLLYLGVKTGGCAGLCYTLELKGATGDRAWEMNGISVVIEEASSPYLNGLILDYSEDLMGGSFRFHNPNVAATCNCGQSFSVNF